MSRWYVVHARVHAEERAASHLSNQGFDIFLPRYKKQRRHARRIETVLRPLFPSYLFVKLDLDCHQWRAINGTIGVASLIASGLTPLPLPLGLVERLIENSDSSGVITLTPPSLKKGQSVTIATGAFADYTALFEEMIDEKRVVLLLNLLGQKVRLQMPVEALSIAV